MTPPQPPPPVPKLSPSLVEGGTTVSGIGVPNSTVEIFVDGKPAATGTISGSGDFALTVIPLAAEQVVTATQLVGGKRSLPAAQVTVKRADLTRIDINPAPSVTIKQGHAHSLTATGTFSNGKMIDRLTGVTWTNTNSNIATVDSEGLITGIEGGRVKVGARKSGVQSAPTEVIVQPDPPVITVPLKAGDSTVHGEGKPFASIQVLINGISVGSSVLADVQGQWDVSVSSSLNENDDVSSTQTVNLIQSDASTVVTVLPNQSPILQPVGNQTVRLGETLSLILTATDPESDVLTFEGLPSPIPENSTLDTTSGRFTFTPSVDQIGPTTFIFLVSDGNTTHQETITVNVTLPKHLFVLLENSDGTVGMIQVTNTGGTQVLNKPTHAVRVAGSTTPPTEPFFLKDQEIQDAFQDALEAKPDDPLKAILYFETDTTTLTPESQQQLQQLISGITSRQAPDIGVIGHTDRTASAEYNHQLSLGRAKTIRDSLVAHGIDANVVEVTGHGENNPLVETADDVNEPLNRRVEIIVR